MMLKMLQLEFIHASQDGYLVNNGSAHENITEMQSCYFSDYHVLFLSVVVNYLLN